MATVAAGRRLGQATRCRQRSTAAVGCTRLARVYARLPAPSMPAEILRPTMTTPEQDQLLAALKARFEKNMKRHQKLSWAKVQDRLANKPAALKSLQAMEASGGEPDVIGDHQNDDVLVFCDCAAESPTGRRSLCYDRAAL